MPKLGIRFAESALTDLEEMVAWFADQGVPNVGDRLVREIISSAELPADHPEMGCIVPEFQQLLLRELIRPPFRVVYRLGPGNVRPWPGKRERGARVARGASAGNSRGRVVVTSSGISGGESHAQLHHVSPTG